LLAGLWEFPAVDVDAGGKTSSLTLPDGDGWRWVSAGEMKTLAFPKIYHPVVSEVCRRLQ
jgi:hypothetical protein